MQYLLFRLGGDAFGIPATAIHRLLPVPTLARVADAPAALAGLLRYQERWIPVVDLQRLRSGRPGRLFLSSRIILIETPAPLGLLVEQATEMVDLSDPPQRLPQPLYSGSAESAATVIDVGGSLVRVLDWRDCLSPELERWLNENGAAGDRS